MNLVSRQNIPTCTMSQMGSFVALDFAPSHFVLKPSAYTLKHGFWKDNVNLRRWSFEASNDGDIWDTLSTHDEFNVSQTEKYLGGDYGTKTFVIERCEKWYRMFRVMSIGKFFVQICGIELYGNLLPKTLDAAFRRRSDNFVLRNDESSNSLNVKLK